MGMISIKIVRYYNTLILARSRDKIEAFIIMAEFFEPCLQWADPVRCPIGNELKL